MKSVMGAAIALCAVLGATQARAAEVFAGVLAHGLQSKQPESGVDGLIGIRTDRIDSLWWLLKPSVHLLGAANSSVSTDFVAVGFNWPFKLAFGGKLYIRPGIGLALTNGETDVGNSNDPTVSAAERARRARIAATRIQFGDPVLFEPEVGLGYRFTDKLSAEVAYLHLSNGEIFHSGKNQGLDDLGVRVNYRFGVR